MPAPRALPGSLGEQLLDRLRRHGQFVLMLSQPAGEGALDVIDPTRVDLSRGVGSFRQALLTEAIAKPYELRCLDDLFRQVRRDEDDPIVATQNYVARHTTRAADPNRTIHTGEHDRG